MFPLSALDVLAQLRGVPRSLVEGLMPSTEDAGTALNCPYPLEEKEQGSCSSTCPGFMFVQESGSTANSAFEPEVGLKFKASWIYPWLQ